MQYKLHFCPTLCVLARYELPCNIFHLCNLNQCIFFIYETVCCISRFSLFPALKQSLEGHKYQDSQELETVVTQWLITQDMHKCLTCHKEYMENQLDNNTIKSALLLRDESKEPKNTCIVNLFSDPPKQSIQNYSYSCPVLYHSNNLHKINYTIVQCYINQALK